MVVPCIQMLHHPEHVQSYRPSSEEKVITWVCYLHNNLNPRVLGSVQHHGTKVSVAVYYHEDEDAVEYEQRLSLGGVYIFK